MKDLTDRELAHARALLRQNTYVADVSKPLIELEEEELHRIRLERIEQQEFDRVTEERVARQSARARAIAASAAPPASSQEPAPDLVEGVRRHTVQDRWRDEADVFIEAALAACGATASTAEVWAWLQRMADDKAAQKPGTLIGMDDDVRALKYTKNGAAAWLDREALRKRLKRRREAP